MAAHPELIGLDAHLAVGRRSASVLASETTLPPKAAIEEIVQRGRESHDRRRHDARRAAESSLTRAAEARAELERLRTEQADLADVRTDTWGPFHADRLWLGTLSGLCVLVLLIGLAVVIATSDALARRPALVAGIVLCALIAYVGGDWGGRSQTRRPAIACCGLAGFGLLAAWALSRSERDGGTMALVELALLATAVAAGVLTGRGRRAVPALREAERAHRLRREIAAASERLAAALAEVDRLDLDFAIEAAPVASRTLRGVEEYLRRIDDARITDGVLGSSSADDLRGRAHVLIAAWPTSLAV